MERRLLDTNLRGSRTARIRGDVGQRAGRKHVPGRKTDVNDAQWLPRLGEYGLLRASFRPDPTCAESGAWRGKSIS